jgi:hypothetical protein
MELYTKMVSTVTLQLPTNDTTVGGATYSFNGSAPAALSAGTPADGKVSVTLPYLQSEGTLVVTWSITVPGPGNGAFTEQQYFDVVTPYLTISEIKDIYTGATDEQAKTVEQAVRHIINAHCGQSFGYATKTLTVEGHGESALRLPERLIELTELSTLTATLNINRSIITSDGWYLKKGWTDAVTPIASTNEYFSGTDVYNDAAPGEPGYEKPSHGYIIVPPGTHDVSTPWRDDYPFSITGRWGYENVPQPVKEAAKLLVNDYACSEIAFRDRYLESIKAADWRLQFSSRAWEYTGNVRADQLLAEYVLLDWAVI